MANRGCLACILPISFGLVCFVALTKFHPSAPKVITTTRYVRSLPACLRMGISHHRMPTLRSLFGGGGQKTSKSNSGSHPSATAKEPLFSLEHRRRFTLVSGIDSLGILSTVCASELRSTLRYTAGHGLLPRLPSSPPACFTLMDSSICLNPSTEHYLPHHG